MSERLSEIVDSNVTGWGSVRYLRVYCIHSAVRREKVKGLTNERAALSTKCVKRKLHFGG